MSLGDGFIATILPFYNLTFTADVSAPNPPSFSNFPLSHGFLSTCPIRGSIVRGRACCRETDGRARVEAAL